MQAFPCIFPLTEVGAAAVLRFKRAVTSARSSFRIVGIAVLSGMMTNIVTAPTVFAEDRAKRTFIASQASDPFAEHITDAARRFTVPAAWIRAVMRQESANDPRARSPKGAIGLMQIMPATWLELRDRHALGTDPYDPRDNILAGTAYLRELHDRFGSPGFLAAYNAGPERYMRHLATGQALPDETQNYVAMLAPIIDGSQPELLAWQARSMPAWQSSPLFVASSERPPSDRSEPALPPNSASSNTSIVDVSALVPLSDGLFARRSAKDRAP